MCLWRIMDGFEKMLWILWIFPNDFSLKLLTKLWPIFVIFSKLVAKVCLRLHLFFLVRPKNLTICDRKYWHFRGSERWNFSRVEQDVNIKSRIHISTLLLNLISHNLYISILYFLLLFLTIDISFKSIFVSTYFIILPFFQS